MNELAEICPISEQEAADAVSANTLWQLADLITTTPLADGSERPRQRRQRRYRGWRRLTRAGRVSARLRTRRGTAVALLVAFAAATGAAAAVTLSGGGRTAPVRLAGGENLCPVGYPELAEASRKLVYPSNFPGVIPRDAGASSCYASLADAQAAGYALAPNPPGDTRLGSLYLAPASATVRRTCQNAQDLMAAVLYCPSRLPAPWIDPAVNGDCPSRGCSAALLSISGSFSAPSSYVGSAPGAGEVTIWVATRKQARLQPYLVGCMLAPMRLLSHTRFRGHPAAWYECAIPIFNGSKSSVLEWRIGPETYGITADGPPLLRRRLINYIAEHLAPQRLAAKRAQGR